MGSRLPLAVQTPRASTRSFSDKDCGTKNENQNSFLIPCLINAANRFKLFSNQHYNYMAQGTQALKQRSSNPKDGAKPRLALLPLVVAAAWLLSLAVLSGRAYFLNPYAVASVLTPALEPFGMPPAAFLMGIASAAFWYWLSSQATHHHRANVYLAIAAAPVSLWLIRVLGIGSIQPMFIETLWLATWTGLSFGELAQEFGGRSLTDKQHARQQRWLPATLVIFMAGCAVWWYCQLCWYYDSFLLGYNDYGHFIQRLHNTLAGQGVLVETPVLPRFWDHFNPGLLLLLPVWSMWPDVHQSFMWQSLALSLSGYLIYRIAQTLGHSRERAALWGIAWLMQPAVGQMNLAYTYGWHPITMAIPLLLATMWALLQRRYWIALLCCLTALSMEEGVFVIVSLTAVCCGGWQLIHRWRKASPNHDLSPPTHAEFSSTLSWPAWVAIGFLAAVAFVIVYKTSGLAEFQTGRFVKLGSNTGEILLSPVLRPAAFWGAWLSYDRWYYLLLLLLPCGMPAIVRGWYLLLPTLLPLGVLIVWDHPPAHCIAFQYASTLLPLFWLAAMTGAVKVQIAGDSKAPNYAMTACFTGVVLSLFVGQLPFSGTTLLDVDGQTYGTQDEMRRRAGQEDSLWLTDQLQALRNQPATCLATGRIAAHLVGMPDIETVGQYIERRERLSQLPDRSVPMRHYQWVILDRRESFQQSHQQTQFVEAEARAAGFVETISRYDLVVLKRVDR